MNDGAFPPMNKFYHTRLSCFMGKATACIHCLEGIKISTSESTLILFNKVFYFCILQFVFHEE